MVKQSPTDCWAKFSYTFRLRQPISPLFSNRARLRRTSRRGLENARRRLEARIVLPREEHFPSVSSVTSLFRNPRAHVNEQRRANDESNQNSRSGRGTRRGLTPLSSTSPLFPPLPPCSEIPGLTSTSNVVPMMKVIKIAEAAVVLVGA